MGGTAAKMAGSGQPNPDNQRSVGQNKGFCPSASGKPAPRWPKQALLPIRGRKNGSQLGKTGVFAHPQQEKRLPVGQNKGFCPSTAGKTALRWAKQALLPIRSRKYGVSLGKIRVFAHPQQEKRLPVGQNRRFCPSTAGKTALRWAKQALLPIRGRINGSPLGKTGVFAHPRQGKQLPDGQNKGFCPSE